MKKYNNYYKKSMDTFFDTYKKPEEKTCTTKTRLNLRADTSKSSNILAVIPRDQTVSCQDINNDIWCKVKYKDYVGFCMKEFLK